MEDRSTSTGLPRVVVLSRSSELAGLAGNRLDGQSVRSVRVASAYEAAAELLAAPAEALVIDLRLMAPRHVGLIGIAREMDAAMLAVGALPVGMNADDLSGVRLVSRELLPEALNDALDSIPESGVVLEATRGGPEAEPPGWQADQVPAGVALSPAKTKKRSNKRGAGGDEEAGQDESTRADLLSPEELSALLENGP